MLNHLIIKPKNTYKNAVVFLHGYGANGSDLIEIGKLWSSDLTDTLFLAPDAPFTCPWGNNSFQWFELTSMAPEKIGEGLKKAGPHMNQYINRISSEFNLSDNKILFVGFSQGTMMALYHLFRRKKSCAGLIGYSGLLFEDEKMENELLSRFPIKLYHGKKDEVINYEFTVKAYKKLKKLDFDVSYHLSQELSHGIDDEGLKLGLKFIEKIFYI